MITIGIRAAPKCVTFAIYDSQTKNMVTLDEVIVPSAFEFPSALKHVRSNILDILREYDVERAGIRATEPIAQRKSTERIQIEGVIQEAFASSALRSYYVGYASSIASRAGLRPGGFKLAVDGKEDNSIENWSEMSKEQREAILCAVGAVNA